MPEPRAMNIAIFLDEVMPINGPLMLVPKSHHAGDLQASHDLATTSYPLWTLDEATVTRLVKEGGIVAPTGKAGGMLLFHGNLVHGSAGNITPYPRKIVYLTLTARPIPLNLPRPLNPRRAAGNPVRVALMGAGKFGSMFLSQVPHTPGLEVPVIIDLDRARAREACRTVGWDAARIAATTFTDDGAQAIAGGAMDVVVEATGNPAA